MVGWKMKGEGRRRMDREGMRMKGRGRKRWRMEDEREGGGKGWRGKVGS